MLTVNLYYNPHCDYPRQPPYPPSPNYPRDGYRRAIREEPLSRRVEVTVGGLPDDTILLSAKAAEALGKELLRASFAMTDRQEEEYMLTIRRSDAGWLDKP